LEPGGRNVCKMLFLLLRPSKLGNTRDSKGMLLLQIAFVNMEVARSVPEL
jgi:hypothetical protein